jgi:hypothetical protein
MKNFIFTICFLLSSPIFAKTTSIVFPRVYSLGSRVEIEVWNYTDTNVFCSGPVYMVLESGATQFENYFDFIPARFSSFRSLYVRDLKNPVRFVHHGIWCH